MRYAEWKVIFYSSSRSTRPVKEFLKTTDQKTKGDFVRLVMLLEKYGPNVGMPSSRRIKSNLHELRIRGKDQIRIFYCFFGDTITLLHAFKKKSQQTPQKELEVATKRLTSLYQI